MIRFPLAAQALLITLVLAAPLAQAQSAPQATVTIERSAYGVPAISAADDYGVGLGLGYAYAEDNLCLLARQIVAVNGDSARYFGADAKTQTGAPAVDSDVFFRWLNSPGQAAAYWQAQPEPVRQTILGYVAGYNRYLARPQAGRHAECRGAPWLRPITEFDIVKLVRRLTVEAGAGHFALAIAAARPPGGKAAALDAAAAAKLASLDTLSDRRGSNAIATGSAFTRGDAASALLANPHFPWKGGLRFYQARLTIPGELDVSGAALAGVPFINIGFNRHMAWTHTVDTSVHFLLYRLQLDPKDATRYLVDGESRAMHARRIEVPARMPDGSLGMQARTVYETIYGPVLQWPGVLDWTGDSAYAILDPNLENDRALVQWRAINRAGSVEALKSAVLETLGMPWVNTVASDAQGKALFMNASVVPNLPVGSLSQCVIPDPTGKRPAKMVVVNGALGACAPTTDPSAPQAGILPASAMPWRIRDDYVQNANDSAWLSNAQAPLTGFSPLVSQEDGALGARGRYALNWLEARRPAGGVTADELAGLVMDDRVAMADYSLDGVLRLCAMQAPKGPAADACQALESWDRRAATQSGAGYFYYAAFMEQAAKAGKIWRTPFDARAPLSTPRDLNVEDSTVGKALAEALAASSAMVSRSGIAPAERVGDVQGVTRNKARIPIHGGAGRIGVYNAIESEPSGPGQREVVAGSSYLQLVQFTPGGPQARTLLTYSQSSDPASPHYADQTLLYAAGDWIAMPQPKAPGRKIELRY